MQTNDQLHQQAVKGLLSLVVVILWKINANDYERITNFFFKLILEILIIINQLNTNKYLLKINDQ